MRDRTVNQREPANRYTLLAHAPDVSTLVLLAGGLLCDQAMRGWLIVATLDDLANDKRPLAILGIDTLDAAPAFSESATPKAVKLVATTGSLRPRSRDEPDTLPAYDFHDREEWICGEFEQVVPPHGRTVDYRMSAAARSFKTRAEVALGHREQQTDATERYIRISAESGRLRMA